MWKFVFSSWRILERHFNIRIRNALLIPWEYCFYYWCSYSRDCNYCIEIIWAREEQGRTRNQYWQLPCARNSQRKFSPLTWWWDEIWWPQEGIISCATSISSISWKNKGCAECTPVADQYIRVPVFHSIVKWEFKKGTAFVTVFL